MTAPVNGSQHAHPSSRPSSPLLQQAMKRLAPSSIGNRQSDLRQSPSCNAGLPYTPGPNYRTACNTSMGAAMAVMHEFASQADISGADRTRISKGIDSLGGTGVGSIPRNRLAALGALFGGLQDLVAVRQEAADAGDVTAQEAVLKAEGDLAKVRGAIVEIGLSLGSCKGELDGARHSGDGSSRLFDSVEAAEKCLAECFRDNETGALLASIAYAVLPESWQNAIEERLPSDVVERMRTMGVDPMQLLHSGLSHATEKELQRLLATGHGADAMKAIFALLKVSEYVVGNDPGSAKPVSPNNASDPRPIDPALQELRDIARDSKGSIFYNSSPVEVNNDLSFLKELFPRQGEPSVPITFVENLLKREDHQRDVAFQHGLDIGQRDEYIRHLEDQLRQQGERGSNVRSRLAAQNNAYSQWVAGSGKLFTNTDPPAVDSEATVFIRRDSVQLEKSGLVSSLSDHDSAFGDGEDSSAEAESRGESVRSGQQNGHGNRIPDVEFEKLQKLFPIQRQGVGGVPASEHIDEQEGSFALSAQSGDRRPENVGADESDHDQTEIDVTDAVVRRDADAPVFRDRTSLSQVGADRGVVERREQGGDAVLNHRQARSSDNQPELTDLVEPGSVRKLMRHYESLASKAMRSSAQVASGAAAEVRSEAAAASAARGSRSLSVEGAGHVKASSLREGVADTEALRTFNPLPRAWMDRAGSATRVNEVNSMTLKVPADQNVHVETGALVASQASTLATVDAVGESRLPVSTADSVVEVADDMQRTEQLIESNDIKVLGVQRSVATGSLIGLRQELEALVGFRSANGHELSAIKNGDPFREYFKSIGGPSFSPPVPPTPQNEEVSRKPSELELVNARLAENRAQNSARPLTGIFHQRTPYGRTMKRLVRSVAPVLHSNPIAILESAGKSATKAPVGAVPDDDATPRAVESHAQAARKMFNNAEHPYIVSRFGPKVFGIEGAS